MPNIKEADTHDFAGFFGAYEDVIRKIKRNELSPDLFADTTATLTNPGTLGTVGSVPRLMDGQSVIIGVAAPVTWWIDPEKAPAVEARQGGR